MAVSGNTAAGVAAVFLWVAPLAAEESTAVGAAQTVARWMNLTGSLRADYFSSSRSLDDREHLFGFGLYLKAAPRFDGQAAGLVEGWIRNSDLFAGGATEGKLRQAYLDLTVGPLDLRIGTQLVVWGRADRINPTDNLTPRDFTLLVPEDDDQRFGVPALKATLHALGVALTGIWLPVFEPHDVPFAAEPGATFREVTPARASGITQWAVRIEQTGRAVDWSLSYFDGFDLFPDLGVGQVSLGPGGLPAVEILLRHHRLRVLGADAAAAVGRFGLRGEAAYAFTEDRRGDDPAVKNSYLFLVVGTDRTFLEHLNVNVQYLFRAVTNFSDPGRIEDPLRRAVAIQQAVVASELDRIQHGASARVSQKWLNETLEAEIAAIYGFTRGDYAIRPKVVYAFSDRITGTLGADLFRGPRTSFFGRLREASSVFAELKVSF